MQGSALLLLLLEASTRGYLDHEITNHVVSMRTVVSSVYTSWLFYRPRQSGVYSLAELRSCLALNPHCKNIRISADILWRVFHILTEPVPHMFVYP